MLFEDMGWVLLPLISLAPHVNNCPHTEHITDCPTPTNAAAGENQTCVVWVAGSDLAAGDQICTSYAYLTPDRWAAACPLHWPQIASDDGAAGCSDPVVNVGDKLVLKQQQIGVVKVCNLFDQHSHL
jgi:hypothetical protein